MKYLVIFRRPEIWVLFGVVFALITFALRPTEPPEEIVADDEPIAKTFTATEEEEPAVVVETLRIENVALTKTKQGAIVDLTLLGRSITEDEVWLDEDSIYFETDRGDPVKRFFAPFEEPEKFTPDEDSLVTVRLWLNEPADSLWVDLQGRKLKAELPK